ncbi:MAG: hypothetical protein J6Y20_13490 [Lachnospiraceae bacterium]|nr:hypothetical protein [Lachnospiraceae bacterium]
MRKVLRKDLKAVLTPVAMMAVSFVVLECLILAGVGLRNVSLISTSIYIAVFAAAITLIYHLYMSGSVFLHNLRERQYFYTLRSEGISKYKVLIFKYLYSVISLTVFAVAYVGALYLDIRLFAWAFPEEKEAFAKLGVRKMICGENGDAFVPAFLATIFEYLTAILLLLAMVFAVVAVTYSVFHRTKLCGFNCVLVYLVVFGAFLKVYSGTINGLTGTKAHVHAGVMQLVMTALFLALAMYMMKTIVPDEPTPDL